MTIFTSQVLRWLLARAQEKVKEHKGIVIAEVELKKREQAFGSSDLISSADLIQTTTLQVFRIKKVVSGPMIHDPEKVYSQTLSVKTRHIRAPHIPDSHEEQAKQKRFKYQLQIENGVLKYRFDVIKQDTPNKPTGGDVQ